MNNKVMIFAEVVDGEINQSFYELLTKAKTIFDDKETNYAALVLGKNLKSPIAKIKESGVDEILYLDDECLEFFHPDYYKAAANSAVEQYDPDVLLIGATSAGEELGPSLGFLLNTGVAAHCTDINTTSDGKLAQMVPAFGGKVIGEIFTPKTKPQIISVKPGMFKANKQEAKDPVLSEIDSSVLDQTNSSINFLNVKKDEVKRMPLDKADIVVCGGYGMGNSKSWETIENVADAMGGAVGCTRPVVDAGLMEDENNMIGTSGKSIRPKVYLGAGIGGATHHVCGMKDAGLIININKDPDAECFIASDYKIVGDGAAILEAILDKLS